MKKLATAATTKRAYWIGGIAAAALAAVGITLYAKNISAAPAVPPIPPPGPPGPVPIPGALTLVKGQMYTLTVKCGSAIPSPALMAGALATIVSTKPIGSEVASGGTMLAQGWTVVFTYNGPTTPAPVLPSTLFGAAPGGCTATLSAASTSPPAPVGMIAAIKVPGPYKSLMSNTMQAYETYLLEIPPQPGETYDSFAKYIAKIQPSASVLQEFDVGTKPAGWPSTTPGVWRYVINYGGMTPPKMKGVVKSPDPWTLPAAFASAAMWATQGQST